MKFPRRPDCNSEDPDSAEAASEKLLSCSFDGLVDSPVDRARDSQREQDPEADHAPPTATVGAPASPLRAAQHGQAFLEGSDVSYAEVAQSIDCSPRWTVWAQLPIPTSCTVHPAAHTWVKAIVKHDEALVSQSDGALEIGFAVQACSRAAAESEVLARTNAVASTLGLGLPRHTNLWLERSRDIEDEPATFDRPGEVLEFRVPTRS